MHKVRLFSHLGLCSYVPGSLCKLSQKSRRISAGKWRPMCLKNNGTHHKYVPLTFTRLIRSYLQPEIWIDLGNEIWTSIFVVIKHFQIAITHFFIVVSSVPVRFITLALFTSISIPPNFFTASPTALYTASSSWISTAHGRHFPPASSTEKKNVPNIYEPSALHYNTEIFYFGKMHF